MPAKGHIGHLDYPWECRLTPKAVVVSAAASLAAVSMASTMPRSNSILYQLLQEWESNMFGKSKSIAVDDNLPSAMERKILKQMEERRQAERSTAPSPATPSAPEAISSISSGVSIVGKIVGNGQLAIFGHVEGEVHASSVEIGNGAQVEGNIVAEELTIGGRVKGTIHANRVKLNSTAIVEGDIYHRSLSIEENAQFAGMSQRQENVIDTPSLVPPKLSEAQAVSIKVLEQGNDAPEPRDGISDFAATCDSRSRPLQ
jgi:cytoskeletal protein CcmA (bactofilin family)